jgi:cullin-associated NEDD8-dissociated protein 1
MSAKLSVGVLLGRCVSTDQDERYMAYSDLANCITEGGSNQGGDEMEKKVVDKVLGGLDDPSNDVQSMAVKCLSVLYSNLSGPRVGEIGAKLTALLRSEDRAKMSDVYSMGLQALVKGASDAAGDSIWLNVYPGVLGGLQATSPSIVEKCLEVLAELLRCLGARHGDTHEATLAAVLPMLNAKRPAVRKRVTQCLCALAAVLPDTLLDGLVDQSITGTKTADPGPYVQLIGALSKTVGHRMGRVLGRLVPVLASFCGSPEDEEDSEEQRADKDDLREGCLSGFESFISKCPTDVLPFMESILSVTTGKVYSLLE